MRVSFGNTFHIYKTRQTEQKVNNFIRQINQENGVDYLGVSQPCRFLFANPIDDSFSPGINSTRKDVLNINGNLCADNSVKDFCDGNGIKYVEFGVEQTPSVADILTRIENSEDENSLVNIDVERLARAVNAYKNNFEMQRDSHRRYHSSKIDTLFKSGEKIEAPRLSVETTAKGETFIKLSGAHKYTSHNYNNLSTFNYPVSSIYFALEEMGAKTIPFSLNWESVKELKSIGVIG